MLINLIFILNLLLNVKKIHVLYERLILRMACECLMNYSQQRLKKIYRDVSFAIVIPREVPQSKHHLLLRSKGGKKSAVVLLPH